MTDMIDKRLFNIQAKSKKIQSIIITTKFVSWKKSTLKNSSRPTKYKNKYRTTVFLLMTREITFLSRITALSMEI